jgi:hypothetical protein
LSDQTDPNCLHCKISAVIIDHYRSMQSLSADQYPDLGSDEVRHMLIHLAQVVADVITPCEKGETQLLRRIGMFSASVVKYAQPHLNADASPAPGVRLQ